MMKLRDDNYPRFKAIRCHVGRELVPEEISTNVDGRRSNLYEVFHLNYADISSKNGANPVSTIPSLALALELSFNYQDGANLLR